MLVFISYAHGDVDSSHDRAWLERISTYFRPETRRGSIELWWDGSIEPGDIWETEIRQRLDKADVAILLETEHRPGDNDRRHRWFRADSTRFLGKFCNEDRETCKIPVHSKSFTIDPLNDAPNPKRTEGYVLADVCS